MNNSIDIRRTPLQCLAIMAMALAVFMASTLLQEYIFLTREVNHLWLNDCTWIVSQLAVPGGVSQLLTSLLSQFYCFPCIGAVVFTIISMCLALTLLATASSAGKSTASPWLLPLALVPSVFLFLSHENSFYNIKGDTSLLLATAAAFAASRIHLQRWLQPFAVGIIVAITYWVAGSVAVVTLLLTAIVLLLRRQYVSVATSVILLLATVWCSVQSGVFTSWTEALTPLQYYEWPTTFFFQLYAWASEVIVLVLIIFGVFSFMSSGSDTPSLPMSSGERTKSQYGTSHKKESNGHVSRFIIRCMVFVLPFALGAWFYTLVHNPSTYMKQQEEWLSRQHSWQEIVNIHEGSDDKTCFISYLNLALAERGELTTRLFEFNPYVVSIDELPQNNTLAFQGNADASTGASLQMRQTSDTLEMQQTCAPLLMKMDELSRDAAKLQSAVQGEWLGAALCNARKSAFEANVLTPGNFDPIEMKRLVILSTLFGNPEVSSKYLHILSKTTFYSSFADSLLNGSKSIKAEVDHLKKTLPRENRLYMKTQIGKLLLEIVTDNPDNKIASQFYEAYILLTLDKQSVIHWAEKLQAMHKTMSPLLQQALCVWMTREECEKMKVSPEIINSFAEMTNGIMPDNYQQTFWNHYAQHQ